VNEDRIRRRLDDLARIGAEAAYLASKGQEAYLADTMDGAMLRNAGERILIKIATVAEKLPDDFRAGHPGVDWVGINRMRNLVAHHYDKVNDDLLWQALTVRIPNLVQDLGLQLPFRTSSASKPVQPSQSAAPVAISDPTGQAGSARRACPGCAPHTSG
jgi:uncharacterized protein with HEPN domain